jgi:ATP-dependent HslUV protease ATP-binding subunit HslU
MKTLNPSEVVEELDRHIVGQGGAKRAVAIALRNRYRRGLLSPEMRQEISPKNILMIGNTGVGKTEIARRLAKLTQAPFVKVEATKFTEVGYVGRQVESMVCDLVEASVAEVKKEETERIKEEAEEAALDFILGVLGIDGGAVAGERRGFEHIIMDAMGLEPPTGPNDPDKGETQRERLKAGKMDDIVVQFEVREQPKMPDMPGTPEGMQAQLQQMMSALPDKTVHKKMPVGEALKLIERLETEQMVSTEKMVETAIERAEQLGIIFIDEIDKICSGNDGRGGPDISREGVQRDILPIVEETTVTTKYGPVKTDHVLFIGAGAFSMSKPSDLIPELQGRFPIRAELEPLEEADLLRILTEPKASLLSQYKEMLQADGVELDIPDKSVERIAHWAQRANSESEDIGARRLHTIVETILGDLLFNAPNNATGKITITVKDIDGKLEAIFGDGKKKETRIGFAI